MRRFPRKRISRRPFRSPTMKTMKTRKRKSRREHREELLLVVTVCLSPLVLTVFGVVEIPIPLIAVSLVIAGIAAIKLSSLQWNKVSKASSNNKCTAEDIGELLKKEWPKGFVAEHKFHPTRQWRFDFAWPARKVAVEVEGGVWTGGRHVKSSGYIKDMEKYNHASEGGWALFRCIPRMDSATRMMANMRRLMD